jgi:xanthine dehydrogenase YagR molybdenum-binding subunit
MTADGKVEIKSAVADIGTGTKTIMTQIAADELGLSMEDITFSYTDSKMPFAPIQEGRLLRQQWDLRYRMPVEALNKNFSKELKI